MKPVELVQAVPAPEGGSLFAPPLERCPGCGAPAPEAVSDGELTNFLCPACAACWHVELGFVHRVDAAQCPGCEHLPTCLLRRALEQEETAWLGGE
jgi:hypothetical protein